MSGLPSRSLVKATFVPSGEIEGRLSVAGSLVSLVGDRPVGVHPVDLEVAVPVRLEDDVPGRRRSGRERQVRPVARVVCARSRVHEAGLVDDVHEVHADRVAGSEAEVVRGVIGAKWVAELERDVRAGDLPGSHDVVGAVAGRIRSVGARVRVVSGSCGAGAAVVVVGTEREGRGEPEHHVLAGVLDPVVVVVEERSHLLRAARVVGHRHGDVEEIGVVLEPHRSRQSGDRHVVRRCVRPFAGADDPVDGGRSSLRSLPGSRPAGRGAPAQLRGAPTRGPAPEEADADPQVDS